MACLAALIAPIVGRDAPPESRIVVVFDLDRTLWAGECADFKNAAGLKLVDDVSGGPQQVREESPPEGRT